MESADRTLMIIGERLATVIAIVDLINNEEKKEYTKEVLEQTSKDETRIMLIMLIRQMLQNHNIKYQA